MRGRTVVALVLLATASIMLGACSKQKQPPPRVVPVVAEAADRKNVPLQVRAIGNVEAYNTVAVKSQVNGEISEVLFREGQDVRKGAMLFRIDPRPFEAALRQAVSALARDRAQARNAEEEMRRYESLAGKGFVSKQEYDRARTNADALNAVVQADEAAVENARLQLEYTVILSPLDGRTGAIAVQRGNVVKANDVALVTINQVRPINVSFAVPEQFLPEIKKHMAMKDLTVEAVLQGGEAAPVRGELTFVDNAVDRTTGTIRLKGTFGNADLRLWPGQFVDVILTLAIEKDRVVVPSHAVQTGQQGAYVYVVKEDRTAELRPVTPGRTAGSMTVIDAGLQAGELVVTDGQLRLTPGAKVEIKGDKAPHGSATEAQSTQRTTGTTTKGKN